MLLVVLLKVVVGGFVGGCCWGVLLEGCWKVLWEGCC